MSNRTPMDEAAAWFVRLQEDAANDRTFSEWQSWLAASAQNRGAYEEIEETVLKLRVRAMPALPSLEEMEQDDYDGSQPVAAWKGRKRTRVPYFAIAASVAVGVVGALLWADLERSAHVGTSVHETDPGQRETFALSDGSTVTLDANSSLRVEMTGSQRSLTLVRGEAFFDVARDSKRPFIVNAGVTRVRAVGTSFNVRMNEGRTVVAVVDGKVEVTSAPKAPRFTAQVAAGEAIAYAGDGALQALPAADVSLATTWMQGSRQYRNEPLRYVLADIDRYTGRHIAIADEATGELRFTGTLNLENSEGWLKGLSVALPVEMLQQADGTSLIRQIHPAR